MHKDIFVRATDTLPLGEVAQRLAACLAVDGIEERKSGKHRDGRCYRGKLDSSDLTVAMTADDRLEIFPYWLNLKRAGKGARVTRSVAMKLAEAGFECFVPSGRWKTTEWNGDGQLYMP